MGRMRWAAAGSVALAVIGATGAVVAQGSVGQAPAQPAAAEQVQQIGQLQRAQEAVDARRSGEIRAVQRRWEAAQARAARREARERRQAKERAAAAREARGKSPSAAKAYARVLMKQKYGWGEDQYRALVALWTRESDWDYTATNPSSGAYGIPQALPAGKMASHGKGWRSDPRPQIRWGLDYIKATYGTPAGAWGFFQANNWY